MLIRKAMEKDVDSLYQLLRAVQSLHAQGRPDVFIDGTNKYDKVAIRKILADDLTPVYVAVDGDDNAIGYAFCRIMEEKGTENLRALKTFYIDDLCVDKDYRKQGIGKKLYEYALGKAKENGCYHLTLNVWHLNETAVKFYEKLGMKPLKTTMETILD